MTVDSLQFITVKVLEDDDVAVDVVEQFRGWLVTRAAVKSTSEKQQGYHVVTHSTKWTPRSLSLSKRLCEEVKMMLQVMRAMEVAKVPLWLFHSLPASWAIGAIVLFKN